MTWSGRRHPGSALNAAPCLHMYRMLLHRLVSVKRASLVLALQRTLWSAAWRLLMVMVSFCMCGCSCDRQKVNLSISTSSGGRGSRWQTLQMLRMMLRSWTGDRPHMATTPYCRAQAMVFQQWMLQINTLGAEKEIAGLGATRGPKAVHMRVRSKFLQQPAAKWDHDT
jgi:hypothetical protein